MQFPFKTLVSKKSPFEICFSFCIGCMHYRHHWSFSPDVSPDAISRCMCAHGNITQRARMYPGTWQKNMTTIMQPLHCDMQTKIQEAQRTTHTLATTRCRTQKTNRLRVETSAPATVAHTRYLSSPAEATLHRKTHGFVLRRAPRHKSHGTFSYTSVSPLPFVTPSFLTPSRCHNFPVTILLHIPCHHFPQSPLPFVTAALRHHPLCHHPSPSPFVIALQPPLPSIRSLCHHCSVLPLPLVTTSHHPSLPSFMSLKSHNSICP